MTCYDALTEWFKRTLLQSQGNTSATYLRPQFQAMLAAASRREFDLVLFWSLDRFSREGVLPTLKHLEVLTSYGVAWKSYTEQYFDSCGIFRDAVISIAATLAKQERLKISERTLPACSAPASRGGWADGRGWCSIGTRCEACVRRARACARSPTPWA